MASSKLFVILAIAAIIAPSVLGKDHIVGDETGWTTNFDYQAWAKAKEFRVGDRLSKFDQSNAFNLLLLFFLNSLVIN